MKNLIKIFISALFFIILTADYHSCRTLDEEFSFIVAADMRSSALPQFRDASHFQGACEAMKKVGPGAFMISPGDIDPPGAVREVISEVLGDDFPWYPVVGNHELEADSHMVYLRNYCEKGIELPHQVNKGPPGCEETTYSFDWDDHHFIVLNQYYDGKSDTGTDGEMVPELLDWLTVDLQRFSKKYTFVFAHEPLIAVPDMDNGRIRHQDDSLNKYPRSTFEFHQILLEHNVTAYFCGHTHNTSVAKINGVWQVDAGHARGIEGIFPEMLIRDASEKIKREEAGGVNRNRALENFFAENSYDCKKILFFTNLTDGESYKNISDERALPLFKMFYQNYTADKLLQEQYIMTFWQNAGLARSTFIKVNTDGISCSLEIYRDDARGGHYTLMHRVVLDRI